MEIGLQIQDVDSAPVLLNSVEEHDAHQVSLCFDDSS